MIRRHVLTGLLAAPLVVRDYSILMPVRKISAPHEIEFRVFIPEGIIPQGQPLPRLGQFSPPPRNLLFAAVSRRGGAPASVMFDGYREVQL